MMEETARDYLSEDARKGVKGLNVTFQEEKLKYSKAQFLQIYKGYDFLENIFVVRTYIQKHYKIDWPTLEMLIKLMGMKIFTRAEYGETPKEFTFARFNSVLELGYINILSDHTDVEKRLFTLNTKGKNIVINFYKMLSGERKIPEGGTNNPMAHKGKQVRFDKKKLDLIKKMNQTPIKEHNKKLF